MDIEHKLNLTLLKLNSLTLGVISIPDIIIELKKLYQYTINVEKYIITMYHEENIDHETINKYKKSLEKANNLINEQYENIDKILIDVYHLT